MKRYAIVRVEGKCGRNLEYYECDYDCCDCKYGDTKEQLVKKIAQALEQNCFKCSGFVHLARKIVEFLGVEE